MLKFTLYADFPQMWHFADPIFLWSADLSFGKSANTYFSLQMLHISSDSSTNKKSFKRALLRLAWDRVVQHFVEICGFGICGLITKICGIALYRLAHIKNLRIFNGGMSPKIRGFAICGLQKKFACPPLIITKRFCSKNIDQLCRSKDKITEQ